MERNSNVFQLDYGSNPWKFTYPHGTQTSATCVVMYIMKKVIEHDFTTEIENHKVVCSPYIVGLGLVSRTMMSLSYKVLFIVVKYQFCIIWSL